MSTYTAKELFADWYKEADKNSDATINAKRIQAINSVLKNDSKEFWFDIIRYALSKPLANQINLEKFITEFKSKDDTFPLLKNENVVRVLALIALCFKLEKGELHINDLISYALINNYLFKPTKTIQIPIFEYAQKYKIENDERGETQIDDSGLDELETKISSDVDTDIWEKSDANPLIEILRQTSYSLERLQEESNILWWIFGEYSTSSKLGFKEIGATNISLIAAKELSELTKFAFEFQSAKSILTRVIYIANSNKQSSKEISIYDIVTAINSEYVSLLIKPVEKDISDLTPLLLAFKKSLDYSGTDSWGNSFHKQTTLDLTKKINLPDLSHQLYNELLFIKHL